MDNPKSARLRLVGTGKRNLKKLLGKNASDSHFVAFAVPIEETVPAKKQTKSLGLRSHHGDILGVLKQMVDQSYDSDDDDDVEMANVWEESEVESEPLDAMETQGDASDTSGGRSFIPCHPHQEPRRLEMPVAIHQVPSVHSVLRRKRKRTTQSRQAEQTEKGEKHRSVPKDFVMPDFTSPGWATMEEVSTKLSDMDISDPSRLQKRSPSVPYKKAKETVRNKQENIFATSATYDSYTEERPSKRKAIAKPTANRTKPPVDLPLLHLADIPRTAALINSPDLSKACNIISPRSAFSRSPRRSPRSNSPGKSPLSPNQPQHQRSLHSPNVRHSTQSPLVSPSAAWTPRTSARLRMSDPVTSSCAHQNTN